ncbi:helix-turn-helix domain-containing protein [Emticicia sp. CRIBPO]|uniref:helix-turn-helix domain-containing protein n=1 Tax=Emticicia sp. CRIBPO TaxID=2683258 RepID=UPI0014123B5D|nr:AraC family transcriptional regulator [Emticicia sp. CRIBPO]NBA87420.1 helix-turn-helix domain-containing protein [Emticicia sp. CRIBPO]
MELYIKNMVCDRCILAVKSVISEAGLQAEGIELGKAVVNNQLNDEQLQELTGKLKDLGFELITDKKTGLVEQIKGLVIDYISGELTDKPKENLSDYLSKALWTDYKTLSAVFSATESHTIGQYYGQVKIEKVKELIDYDEMSLSQISDTFNYSSPSHLTKQFKKVTGITPKEYKNNKSKRVALDKF